MSRGPRDDWRRASGSLNKRSRRAAIFDAAARSADSFSSVAGRWSLSRRRRSRAASDHKRLRKRRSFHASQRAIDDGTPSLHTNTPFVIATTADEHRANQNAHLSPRYASFGSEGVSAASLRDADSRYAHPALRPTFDALRLLRKIPEVMAGWVQIKCPTGPGRLRWSTWTMFWAELRGGYILLTRDHNSLAAVSDSTCQNPVDYIFGATHCQISRVISRSGAVRLRLTRTSSRRRNDSATATSSGIVDDDDLNFRPIETDARLSERSGKSTSSEKRSFGSTMKRIMSGKIKSKPSSSELAISEEISADLTLKIQSAPEADKWEWALRNTTQAYESKRLGDFQLIDALGAGAFGRVYLVHDAVKGEYLALKVLEKSLVFRDRLHFESAINERLTLELVRGKPFMAQLRYAFQTAACLYLVTDFYEGGDLFSFLRSHHSDVRESQAIRIIAEVILALQSMHDMGIVYRDLKPENVLLDSDGHVRLADLGLAKLLNRENDYLTKTICGSLSYAAPEMLSEKQYGTAFDMWTLGVFIYQVLTGDMPFETENRSRQEILEDQRKAEIPVNGLSDEGYSLVCALLRPNPLRRPTCEDLKQYPIFAGINWDELMQKVPHPNSVKDVMDKISLEARSREKEGPKSENVGGESGMYLLRNFDPDEWSNMSFSDVSDGCSTASFFKPNFSVIDDLPNMTRWIPGWSLTTDNVVPMSKPQLSVRPLGRKPTARSARRLSEKSYR
eukprot:TRINITY_DN55443_c0_g1_i1.p1 TRINITY_DN55443_c0_g1~~TRINITY_DN55443_c0_g1_i1.p1  ORF type:complete len:734 (-),score=99.69 TRINITY_DN55443_c0_g1_i1:6866-9067(-)